MGVAALSTSAIALTAGSTPPPAGPPAAEAGPAFANLVAQAKSEEKAPGQQASDPEAGAEGDGATAIATADDAAPTPIEAGADDKGVEQPLDLLADMEAMVAAAGQIVVAQPAPVAVAATTTQATMAAQAAPAPAVTESTGRLSGEPVVISRTIARLAPKAMPAAPVATSPAAIDRPAAEAATATSVPVAARAIRAATPTPATETVQRAALAGASGGSATDAGRASFETVAIKVGSAPDATDSPDPAATDRAAPATADAAAPTRPARGNIATLLTSLKSAFAPGKPADIIEAPAEAEAEAATPPAPAASETVPQTAVPSAAPTASAAPAQALPAAIAETADETAAPAASPELADRAEPVIAATPKAGKAAAASVTPSPAAAAPQAPAVAATPGDAVPQSDRADRAAPSLSAPADDAPAAAVPPAPVLPADAALAGIRAEQPAAAPAAPPVDGAAPAASQADMAVDRHLDLARDSQWLDRLARDISQAATQQGHLKFQLNPEHLGALVVEIANGAAGTAIKLTAETDQARAIIADAQPQLVAEVRAQGLRIAETRVELNNQPQQQSGTGGSAFAQSQQGQAGQQRQPSADHQPFARTQAASRDDAGDSAPREDGELYA